MDPDNGDDDLTSRFNALKTDQNAPRKFTWKSAEELDREYSEAIELAGQDLLKRFKELGGKVEVPSFTKTQVDTDAQLPQDDTVDTLQHGEPDDKELEQLLAELREVEREIKLEEGEEQRATNLLKEAREALETSKAQNEGSSERETEKSIAPEDTTADVTRDEENCSTQNEIDDDEMKAIIQQALEEAEIENLNQPDEAATQSPLRSADQADSDDDLVRRLQDLKLPAVPTTALPSPPKPARSTSNDLPPVPRQPPGLKKYTDEEIDSWCCICLANAAVKCLGCDGDLYCALCWHEGHQGEAAGWEERRHRAVRFVPGSRDGKEKPKLVAA